MNYWLFVVPLLVGLIYLIWSEKTPALEDKIVPVVKFLGYFLGIGVILVLLFGMFA